jgi:ABC-type dipeptide/oligopeptide/nickel transport system permease subunit
MNPKTFAVVVTLVSYWIGWGLGLLSGYRIRH